MAWYDVGSISVTNGSTTVTGTGTDFISGVQVGEGLYISGDLYEIATIVSGTQLTLADAYLGSTATGQDYKIIPTQSLVADLSSGVADLISDFADVRDYAGSGKFNDGTVSSPAITFTQDQNNGLYRIGSDNWGLVAGGSKALEIKTAGVKLDDNKKVTFGAGDDLQIYHSGTHSYISDQGTGNLNILASSTINLLNSDSSDYMARFNDNGSVQLYHDGSTKLATTSTGVDVTGTVTADGLTVDGNGTIKTDAGGILSIGSTDTSTFTGQLVGKIEFETSDASATATNVEIRAISNDEFGRTNLDFRTGESGVLKTRALIDYNGDVSFYEDTGSTAKMVWDASAEQLRMGNAGYFASETSGGGAIRMLGINAGNTAYIGPVDSGPTSAIFNASSSSTAAAFYTSGTESMRIDSAGNVGIGSTNPSGVLEVNTGSGAAYFTRIAGDNGVSAAAFAFGLTTTGTRLTNSGDLSFRVGAVGTAANLQPERAKIDTLGNLLIGTTDTSVGYGNTGSGIALRGQSGALFSRTNSFPVAANRNGNDGEIINLRKDGFTAGSIGTAGADLTIGTGNTGMRFRDEFSVIQPHNTTTNGTEDGVLSLGKDGARFKDLYLSGGVYLGGTDAVNKLDDYEEGNWTPEIVGSTSGSIGSFTVDSATYTKTGNVVNVRCYLNTINVSTHTVVGKVYLSGMPFTPISFTGVGSVYYTNILTTDETDESIQGYVSSSGNYVLTRGSSITSVTVAELNTGITSGALMFSATYTTNA